MKCSVCGTELDALSMSDIEEDKCQGCVGDIIDKIDTNDESPETRWMADGLLDSIIRKNNDRALRGIQRRNRNNVSRRRPYRSR